MSDKVILMMLYPMTAKAMVRRTLVPQKANEASFIRIGTNTRKMLISSAAPEAVRTRCCLRNAGAHEAYPIGDCTGSFTGVCYVRESEYFAESRSIKCIK